MNGKNAESWFYLDQLGNVRGPVSEPELERLFQSGEVTAISWVWREGLPNWGPFYRKNQQQAVSFTPQPAPPVIGRTETNQETPANESSPWRRAMQPAGTAFGIGSFLGIACVYSIQSPSSFGERMLIALCFGVLLGLVFAASTYVVAALFYQGKEQGGAVKANGSKAKKKDETLAWVGIVSVIAVLWLIGKSQLDSESRKIQKPVEPARNEGASPATQPNRANSEISALKSSAEKGDAWAQNCVGMMYYLGHGVPQDYGEAAQWFFKAARQGDAGGQYYAGEALEYGRGVPQNDVAAYTWYSLAAEQAYSLAIIRRDNLSRRLTPDQIAEVQWYVKSFKPAK